MIDATNSKSRKLAALFLLLAGLAAARNVASWPARLEYPGDGDRGGDSIPLADIVDLRNGVAVYAVASSEVYIGANWGPLFYLLGARLVDSVKPSYRPLRLLSAAGILGCAAGCSLLAFWYSRSRLAAALAPLTFLSFGFLTRHGISVRADTVALLLSLAGFLIVFRFRNSRVLLLAVPFFLLGFYYKQQLIAGPLAVLLFCLLERQYRLATEFVALLALGGLTLLLYFQFVIFAGQAFLHHFIFYNILPFTDWAFGLVFFGVFLLIPFLVGLRSLRARPDKLLACYVGVTVSVSLVTSPRAGGEAYYFYESALLLSVLFAALIATRVAGSSPVAGLLLLFAVSLLVSSLSSPPPTREDSNADRAVQDYLKQHFAPHTPALGYYSGELIRAGLDTPITNIFHFSALVRQGRFRDKDLAARVRRHGFGLVVLDFDLQPGRDDYAANFYLTRSVREAILESYRLAASLEMPRPARFRPDDRFYLWVPRP